MTDLAVLPLIARHGLLSAEALCRLFEVPEAEALLSANRRGYVALRHRVHGDASLRRQLMPDKGLAARLAPGLSPACWRRFINAHVFFWVRAADAGRLDAAEPGRAQVTLRLSTARLLAAGLVLHASPINGGALDRQPPARRRLRDRGLYREVGTLAPDEPVREVALRGALPPGLLAVASLSPLSAPHTPALP